MDVPSKVARMAAGAHGLFKAGVYQRTRSRQFIESSSRQAQEIAKTTGKPVFCVESGEMLTGLQPDVRLSDGQADVLLWLCRKFRSIARFASPSGSVGR